MTHRVDIKEAEQWLCSSCGIALESRTIEVAYMKSKYPVELPQCPKCGIAFVPEELALGKMAEIEKILEDK